MYFLPCLTPSVCAQVWAVMERIPRLQEQFATLVPEMAHTYPFELDVFQKEVRTVGHRVTRRRTDQKALHSHRLIGPLLRSCCCVLAGT
jgi:hypothetical protein